MGSIIGVRYTILPNGYLHIESNRHLTETELQIIYKAARDDCSREMEQLITINELDDLYKETGNKHFKELSNSARRRYFSE